MSDPQAALGSKQSLPTSTVNLVELMVAKNADLARHGVVDAFYVVATTVSEFDPALLRLPYLFVLIAS